MRISRTPHHLRMVLLGAAVGVLLLDPAIGLAAESAPKAPSVVDGAARSGSISYLSLGTSLALGYQPGKGKTKQGFVDELWRNIRQQIPGLGLRNVGCRGETSRSMITGENSRCHYRAGSQLDAAVNFLRAHPGQVAFITVEVGANDLVNRCFDGRTGLIDKACAVDQRPRLQRRLERIVGSLSSAAGEGVPIVGMTYYDPFLGLWGLIPRGRAMARADQRAWKVLNAGLTTAFERSGAQVADVAATFRIDDFRHTAVVRGRGRLPVNVALTCRWTWFCSPDSFTDPHANPRGHQKIANTFNRKLQRLLP